MQKIEAHASLKVLMFIEATVKMRPRLPLLFDAAACFIRTVIT
jgi:hypothetical protein